MASALLQKTPYGSFGGQPGGTLAKYQGKDLSPSVMDKEELPLTAEELARSLAERDAIGPPTVGPVSIDPTDWLTPGGLAKVGAILKGVLAPAAAVSTAMLVGSRAAGPVSQLQRSVGASQLGAFRSANDTMLTRGMTSEIKDILQQETRRELTNPSGHLPDYLQSQLLSKLSDKEIAKYGTPEFKLDKWLHSTQTTPNETPSFIKEVPLAEVLQEGKYIQSANNSKAEVVKSLAENIPPEIKAMREAVLPDFDSLILNDPARTLVEDFNLAQKQGKTLLDSSTMSDPYYDIASGALNLTRAIQKHNIPVEAIEKGSLQQIVSKVNQADDDAVRVLKKSMEAKSQVIRARTGELFNAQRDPDAGMFIKLTDPKDLAQETDILNHCIGAVGRDNDKYIPAFDTVTGKFNDRKGALNSSFAQYAKEMEQGESEFYSYRPKGLPEATLEVKTMHDGERRIVQAYGKEDAALTAEQTKAVSEFARAKRITFDPRADVPDWEPLIDDAGNMIQANPVGGPANFLEPQAAWPFPINNGPIVPAPD